MKLSIKITLLFILISIISISVISYLSYFNGKTAIENEVIARLLATNLLKEAEMKRWLNNTENLIELLARNAYFKDELQDAIASHDPTNPAHVEIHRSIIEEILIPGIEEGGFFEFFILRPSDGLTLISTDEKQVGKYNDDKPFFINGKSQTYIQDVYYSMAPVEQQINSIMGSAGNEIMNKTQKGSGSREDEIAQKIHITNLCKCVVYLARQIDKLAQYIKGIND